MTILWHQSPWPHRLDWASWWILLSACFLFRITQCRTSLLFVMPGISSIARRLVLSVYWVLVVRYLLECVVIIGVWPVYMTLSNKVFVLIHHLASGLMLAAVSAAGWIHFTSFLPIFGHFSLAVAFPKQAPVWAEAVYFSTYLAAIVYLSQPGVSKDLLCVFDGKVWARFAITTILVVHIINLLALGATGLILRSSFK
jgi:hypothetical protein